MLKDYLCECPAFIRLRWDIFSVLVTESQLFAVELKFTLMISMSLVCFSTKVPSRAIHRLYLSSFRYYFCSKISHLNQNLINSVLTIIFSLSLYFFQNILEL